MKRTTVIVNVEDLEKIKKYIDDLKRNKRADITTTKDSKRTYEEYDFTEKENADILRMFQPSLKLTYSLYLCVQSCRISC